MHIHEDLVLLGILAVLFVLVVAGAVIEERMDQRARDERMRLAQIANERAYDFETFDGWD
jgi:hypothetical protein